MAAIKFKFLPADKKKTGTFPRGWIVLGNHFVHREGDRLLSAQCFNTSEVEGYVELLKDELDKILVQAKKRFKDSN